MAQAKQAHRVHATITLIQSNETITKVYYKPAGRAKALRIPQIILSITS